MSILSNLGYANDVQQSKDTVGGGRTLLESGIYDATVKAAYLGKSAGGAVNLTVIFTTSAGEYKEVLYLTSKSGSNYYTNSRGEKQYLPGFVTADDLCLLAAQKPLSQMATEKKVFKVYNPTLKAESPTEVDALAELEGKEVKLGILKEKTFKSVKQADGTYATSDETTESNVISKIFGAKTNKTANECRAKVENAEFIEQWKARWEGKISDRTAGKQPTASAGVAGSPRATKPTESLFS